MAKVVQVVTQMEAGGAQRIALWLADGLALHNHEVEVWYLYEKRRMDHGSVPAAVFATGKPGGLLDYAAVVVRMAAAIRRSKADVIITHTHYANVLCQIFTWLFRIPKRIAVQHSPFQTFPKLARILDPVLGKLGVYTDVVAVSGSVSESLQETDAAYRKRLKVICNGVPESMPHAGAVTDRKRLGIPEGAFTLVHIGRLCAEKNQSFLLEVVAAMPEAYLLLVGDGEMQEEHKSRAHALGIADRVVFTGEVPYTMVGPLLHVADVFVFPSLYESFGLALVEAMRAGLPVMASDTPAAHEVIGDAGRILPLSVESWVCGLGSLSRDACLRRELGARARERSGRYSINQMVEMYETLFT